MKRVGGFLLVIVAIVLVVWTTTAMNGQAPGALAVPNIAGRIMTVTGPIDPGQLGHTIMHEHVYIDFRVPDETAERWQLAGRTKPLSSTAVEIYNRPLTMDLIGAVTLGAQNRDNYLIDDERVQLQEIAEFKRYGGGTIVDTTSIGLDRNPTKLRRASQASGLNIVMGASWYNKAWHPKDMDSRSVESLTDEIVRDVTVGVGGTGIRAGIIGEVGTLGNPLTPNEIKVIRASGRASRLTGAAVSLHTAALLKEQPKILDMLAEEGADLRRVVIGHSDALATDVPFMTSLIQRGATIQFDLLGRPQTITRTRASDIEVAKGIMDLINAGFGDRIVVAQDVCTKAHLKAYGGSGYSFIEEYFIPYLKRQGVTDAQINQIMVENPKRILTFAAPQPARTKESSVNR